ncbi:MAG: peptidyl-prolyl cis-trans isomerase [Neisseria sp.]|nr:peptidyl-prolyl cis-trans isomerase [Neisseria sp.]
MKKSYLIYALMPMLLSGSLMAQTIVTVNGTKIDSGEIDRQVRLLQQQNGQIQDGPELRNELTQYAVTRLLVAQEARRLKLDQQKDFKDALAAAQKSAKEQGADKKADFKQLWDDYQTDLLNQAFVAHVLRSQPVTDEEIKKVYEAGRARYQGTSEVQLGEILTPKKEDAEKAVKELKAKKPFAEVARRYSADPAAKQNGGINPDFDNLKDLQDSAPPIYAAVKDLKKGQFTNPVSGNGVYGVFYVQDKRPVKLPSLEEAKNGIAQNIRETKVDQAIGGLYQKASIVPAK